MNARLHSKVSDRRWFFFGLALFCLGLSGCPRKGLHRWIFHKYNGSMQYSIGTLGREWRKVKVTENDIAFYNTIYSAIIQINSTCRKDYEDVSLPILRDHLLYGLTDRKIVEKQQRMLDRRAALLTRIKAKLDGVAVEASVMIMKKNSCIYDFAYISRPRHFGRGIGDFYRVIHGFKVLRQ
jgi:hypothetical protein